MELSLLCRGWLGRVWPCATKLFVRECWKFTTWLTEG